MIKRKALVTGGTRGIGKSIVKKLKKKYNLYFTGQIYKKNKNYLQLNLADTNSVNKFIKKISKMNFDILVNNAGINNIKYLDDYSEDEIKQILNVNLGNLILITKSIINGMKKNKWGRIVNISSIWGINPCKKRSIYSLTKTALLSFSKSLAIEYGKFNIYSNSISPGFIWTDLTKKSLSPRQINILKKRVPIQRFGTANEIAEIVLFLCRETGYINGANIVADGGFSSGYEV